MLYLRSMPVKDYYQILELPYNANEQEIKKAYRKMAMRYHPDKNTGNILAVQHFREVQEAYTILSNPVKRSEYHQIRWQNPGYQNRYAAPVTITPRLLIREAQKMADQVRGMDVFRMNQEALFRELGQLMSPRHILVLQESAEPLLVQDFIEIQLRSMDPLAYNYWIRLLPQLVQIAGTDNHLLEFIHRKQKEKLRQRRWIKIQPVLLALTVAMICLLIYIIA